MLKRVIEANDIPTTTGGLSDCVIDCSSNFCLRQKRKKKEIGNVKNKMNLSN